MSYLLPNRKMIKRILIALTVISFVLLAFTSPLCAQERQVGTRLPTGDRTQEGRRILDPAGAEKLRHDLVTAYVESEALVKFFAGYEFLRQNAAMEGYEAACELMSKERVRVEQLSINDVMLEADYWPNSESVNRIIELSRTIRADEKFKEVIKKAEGFSQASLQSLGSSAGKRANSRGVIAAPAYIAPNCNFDDPSNFPSGTDLAIANAVGIALHVLYDVLPDEEGFLFGVPFLPKILLVIAAGITDQITNALTAVAADGRYCESIRLYIEDKLANESGFTTLLITDDFYLSFTYKTVKASISKAVADGVPINCANARLAEAAALFSGDTFSGTTGANRIVAFKKLRAAFRNIGADVCVQE
ncbi:MAG: hypothetical protein AAB401_19220 [Acidobacteriota bacterium]